MHSPLNGLTYIKKKLLFAGGPALLPGKPYSLKIAKAKMIS
jgi:hypothetical protein